MIETNALNTLNKQIQELVDNFELRGKGGRVICSDIVANTICGLFMYRTISDYFLEQEMDDKSEEYYTPSYYKEHLGFYIPSRYSWNAHMEYIKTRKIFQRSRLHNSIKTLLDDYVQEDSPFYYDLSAIVTTGILKKSRANNMTRLANIMYQVDNLSIHLGKGDFFLYASDTMNILYCLVINEVNRRIRFRCYDLEVLIKSAAECTLQDYYDLKYYLKKNNAEKHMDEEEFLKFCCA